MSIAELGFRICQRLYQNLPATVASVGVTYGATRYISMLNLPPQESAKFAAILAVALTISTVLINDLKIHGSESKARNNLPPLTFGALVAYGLYSRVNPVPGLWPFVKLCTVAFGSFAAAAFVSS